jgi:hypothetical protein
VPPFHPAFEHPRDTCRTTLLICSLFCKRTRSDISEAWKSFHFLASAASHSQTVYQRIFVTSTLRRILPIAPLSPDTTQGRDASPMIQKRRGTERPRARSSNSGFWAYWLGGIQEANKREPGSAQSRIVRRHCSRLPIPGNSGWSYAVM